MYYHIFVYDYEYLPECVYNQQFRHLEYISHVKKSHNDIVYLCTASSCSHMSELKIYILQIHTIHTLTFKPTYTHSDTYACPRSVFITQTISYTRVALTLIFKKYISMDIVFCCYIYLYLFQSISFSYVFRCHYRFNIDASVNINFLEFLKCRFFMMFYIPLINQTYCLLKDLTSR